MVWGSKVLSTDLFQRLIVKSTILPKTLHLTLQTLGIEITQHINEVIYFLLVLCSSK